MTHNELLGIVQYYERALSDMQEHVFFCQDENGNLRRWIPPKPISHDGKAERSDG